MGTTRANSKLREIPVRRHPSVRAVHDRDHEAAWQLLRDDVFDRIRTDHELERILSSFASESASPHAELVRRMLGMEMPEREARAFYRRLVDHWRELSHSLGRPVHVRVAALDLLTLSPDRDGRLESRPIVVTPSLLEKALEEAGADGVTGLPQRSHFMGLLRHELRQRRRRGVVVAYLDLDGMKRVNDEYGHARGDEVLRTFARVGRGVLRQGDTLARIGGDEFALLLVDVGLEEAEAITSRFRERFEAAMVPLAVSFSVGLSVPEHGDSAEEVLGRADAAMYREKRARAAKP